MRREAILLFCLVFAVPLRAQESGMPTDDKARKTYDKALEFERKHDYESALDEFRKADKQDGGHCRACKNKVVLEAVRTKDWKAAETAAVALVAEAQGDNMAAAHDLLGSVYLQKGIDKKKDEWFTAAHEEFGKALALKPDFADVLFDDGRALALLKQDDAAKERFEQFLKLDIKNQVYRQRATLYATRPELVRARMAPPFAVTTLDGRRVALDDLQGKVVLLDFWATWCAPCQAALPRIRELAKKFQGQPFVILSVSLDSKEKEWKDFVVSHEMSWLQYCDGGFTGPLSTAFGVHAIPQTFTIDSDGVVQDQHIGDASIEGNIKKLLARAQTKTASKSSQQ